MVAVKSVKIDGEMIHVFQSVIYIFETNTAVTLEIDMIVSEVTVNKYKTEKTLIIEIELVDGRRISSIMHVKILSGNLPQMNLYMELDDTEDYQDFLRINENASSFPVIGEGITIEEIRKVEMPNERVSLKLILPIDQVEWLKKQKGKDLNVLFKDLIYNYWEK
ncbi:hypothetical protein ACF5W4_09810 [Bacillota bacterium Lsc_1132]